MPPPLGINNNTEDSSFTSNIQRHQQLCHFASLSPSATLKTMSLHFLPSSAIRYFTNTFQREKASDELIIGGV
ncbi:hypothetical protein ACH3XW_22690 [Acanthocheilonema viteae]